MNNDPKMREYLSAMADGELSGPELLQTLQFADRDDGKESWRMYHLIGDVLRSTDVVRPVDYAFAARVRQQLAKDSAQPHSQPAEVVTVANPAHIAANDAVFKWKLVAGFASLAAVASIAWNVWVDVPTGAQTLAVQTPAANPATQVAQTSPRVAPLVVSSADNQVMLRDPRLDELLAARQQLVGTNALQLPAGFLRNATFERVKSGAVAQQ